ncbi:hypothetical protein [Metabacillus litoralis]|nr:hypothetical protein [Metabacillus litoralis]
MSKKKVTPSKVVDQKQLVNDKAEKAKANNYEDDHIRNTTSIGAANQ